MVLVLIEGVVKLPPVKTKFPLNSASNHSIVTPEGGFPVNEAESVAGVLMQNTP